ncbi:MAG: prolipoprotein diacylglyceryl transferase [Bacteroidales bacterium]|nr:prolipoprotein diacylglyceryl transferase [Bacteroidales bacterium]
MVLNYITWNVDPVALSLGSLEIRWYGLCWAFGFLFGYLIMNKVYKRERMPEGSLDSLLIYMLVFTVVGARLGHCLFYEPEYYLSRPLEMLKIWEGGLASHGGAIGILLGLWIYVRRFNKSTKKEKTDKQRINYIWILDRIVIAVCLVGALIRVGNVFNHEIYGTPTSLPWGFVFLRGAEQFCGTVDNYEACPSIDSCCPPSEWLPCHPTGLYEAFFCLLAMGILLWMYFKRDLGDRRPGLMFGTFLVIIFGSRIAIEFLKNVQVDFERNMVFDMGQWLSVPFVILGIVMIVLSFRKPAQEQQKP